ncbi:MAG TPA: MBOAT family O-acyltransferase, partial [Spirochaetota bacterium]|nr:MBOAT family O-acyltransferase [Spirochaetota bacterium]
FIISKVLLPIGVSFIVFEKITYIVDIYRHEGNPSPSFINYLLYVFFFPKLLAGPIIKYHDIAAQLETHKHDLESVVIGVTRFCLGFAKKVFIADTMGEVVDQVFGLGTVHLGFYNAWLGVICYTLQIYFDFSGYSDMAIGLARIFGFKLFENFNNPYISKNFTEFWRRWHISLSSWIRNYLYIPMGGNRVPKSRMYFNLWLCFFLSGIWHGASWSFVVWGAYHGFFMILDKLGWTKIQKKIPGFINITITFILVMIGWTIFRAETIGQAFYFMKTMINPADMNGSFIYITSNVKFFFCVGIAFCFLPASDIFNKLKEKVSNMQMAEVYKLGISSLLFILSLCKMAAISFNPFLYFRF